jgi:hypothetical protein
VSVSSIVKNKPSGLINHFNKECARLRYTTFDNTLVKILGGFFGFSRLSAMAEAPPLGGIKLNLPAR